MKVLETIKEYLPNAADVKETDAAVVATVTVPKTDGATAAEVAEKLRCALRQASSREKHEG